MTDFLPSASVQRLRQRAQLLAGVRDFFAQRDVLEVETPILSRFGNSDPGMEQLQACDGRYLRTSPEYAMKRLLAAGIGDCYELGRVFRAGESGRHHNPEFSLLEWYRSGWGYAQLMDEVAALICTLGEMFGQRYCVHHVCWQALIQQHSGLDPLSASLEQMAACIEESGLVVPAIEALDRDGWLDLLISSCVQPALPKGQLTLVSLYPASQAALARIHAPDPRFAERFEAFLGPLELANGYGELTDAGEQRSRFETENAKRRAAGRAVVPLDEALLAALEAGMPACSGVALGMDRLLMALTDEPALDAVLAFPQARA